MGRAKVTETASVLVDRTARVGALSYRVPANLEVSVGDAVGVPLGTRTTYGLVLGPGDPARATRDIRAHYGPRAHPDDISTVFQVADDHFSDPSVLARRLYPTSGKSAAPLELGPPRLVDGPAPVKVESRPEPGGRYLLRGPLVDVSRLVAEQAAALASRNEGSVLVLCPTVALVAAVTNEFESGAARLDAAAPPGAWTGFVAGTVKIGIGTRSAAWYSPQRLAGIVVAEEAHPGHLEQTHPHTHARDVAVARATARNAPLVLIGAAPSPDGLGAGVKTVRAGSARTWPSLRTVNLENFPPHQRLLPPSALTRFAAVAKTTPVTFVGQSRTRIRVCVSCDTPRPCRTCGSPTACPHPVGNCPNCGSSTCRTYGWDIKEPARKAGANHLTYHSLLTAPRPTQPTEVVLFGLDSVLRRPGLTPTAGSARLLYAAARAAGLGGTVWMLTENPAHPLLAAFDSRDSVTVARLIWEEARSAKLPPFQRMAELFVPGGPEPDMSQLPGVVFGPSPTPTGGWQTLVLVDPQSWGQLRRPIEALRAKHRNLRLYTH